MTELRNSVTVITGAGGGIGRALADSMASRGARLALVDVDEVALGSVAAELSRTGCTVSTHVTDVSDRDAMAALPDEVLRHHGAVDILVNNAGVSVGALFDDHSVDDAEWLLGINLDGVVHGCAFFLPVLKESPAAHIVNVSSMFGVLPMPGQAIYSASKSAVRGLSDALGAELAGTSVRVTTVHPGAVRSDVIRSARMPDEAAKAKALALQQRFGMATDSAAEKIVRAVERNKLRVVVGADAHVADVLGRLLPVTSRRLLGRVVR